MSHFTKHHSEAFYCFRCLHRFSKNNTLKNHEVLCKEHPAQVIKMLEEVNSLLNFKGTYIQHPIQYMMYADFEFDHSHNQSPHHDTFPLVKKYHNMVLAGMLTL